MSTGLVQEVPHEGNNKDIFNSGVKAGIGHVANQQATQQAMQQGQVSAYHKGASDIAGAVNEKLAGLGQQGGQEQQLVALVTAAKQGDQKASEIIRDTLERAKQGDQTAIALANSITQIANSMAQQAG